MRQVKSSQKGSVLIVVLIMTAFMLSIAMLLYEKSDEVFTGTTQIHAENQGAVYAASALEAISYFMELDDAAYDAHTDVWVSIPPIPVQNGFVSVEIKPADDRLSVNMLANADDNVSRRAQEAFSIVLGDHGFDDDLWRIMKDWVTSADTVKLTNNVDRVTFSRDSTRYTAKYGELNTLAELRLIPELKSDYRDLAEFICMGDADGKININFASAETIKALLPEISQFADEIVEVRQETPFQTKDELYTMMGTSQQEAYIAVLPFFDVKSTLFYVRIEVDLMESVQYYHALFKRGSRRLTLESYIEGNRLEYY